MLSASNWAMAEETDKEEAQEVETIEVRDPCVYGRKLSNKTAIKCHC